MRQSGKANEGFVDLLGRLREGRCTDNDYELPSSYLITLQRMRSTCEPQSHLQRELAENYTGNSLDSGRTNYRLGKVPLVIGMPVMINQNYDVEGGIVNGTTGVLKKIRYRVGQDGLRHAISCVVESPSITASPLPELGENCAAVLEDSVDPAAHKSRLCNDSP